MDVSIYLAAYGFINVFRRYRYGLSVGGPHPFTMYFIALHSNIGFCIFVRLL
jgi:hypothetical protein